MPIFRLWDSLDYGCGNAHAGQLMLEALTLFVELTWQRRRHVLGNDCSPVLEILILVRPPLYTVFVIHFKQSFHSITREYFSMMY